MGEDLVEKRQFFYFWGIGRTMKPVVIKHLSDKKIIIATCEIVVNLKEGQGCDYENLFLYSFWKSLY